MQKNYKRSPKHVKKWQTPYCYHLSFTEKSLRALSAHQHQQPHQPEFLRKYIHLDISNKEVQLAHSKPNLLQWGPNGSYLITPNLAYLDTKDLIKDQKKIREHPHGLKLNAWYIHPAHIKHTPFESKECRASFHLAKQTICSRKLPTNLTVQQLEEKSGTPHIATLLDLNETHIPLLEHMHKESREHIEKEYGVTKEDLVHMYYHFFIKRNTIGLHLHIRVNQAFHPMEIWSEYSDADVLTSLKENGSLFPLIIKRGYVTMNQKRVKFLTRLPDVTARRLNTSQISSAKKPLSTVKKLLKRTRSDTFLKQQAERTNTSHLCLA